MKLERKQHFEKLFKGKPVGRINPEKTQYVDGLDASLKAASTLLLEAQKPAVKLSGKKIVLRSVRKMKKDLIAHLEYLEAQAQTIGYNPAQIELIGELKGLLLRRESQKILLN